MDYVALNIEEHGGGCCGITHIFGFNSQKKCLERPAAINGYLGKYGEKITVTRQSIINAINETIEELCPEPGGDCDCEHCSGGRDPEDFERLFEVSLASYQWEEFEPVVLEFGFKMVTEFLNSNSGNRVRVYHFVAPGVMS